MRVTRVSTTRQCAICERTLLLGERAVRYSPNGGGTYVDVCPLCQDHAVEDGWIKEGSPTTPTIPVDRRRGPRFSISSLLGSRAPAEAPVATEPIMALEVTVPDDAVGAVNGDLNARRGRLQGMDPAGGMTTIRAEVPMAEVLTYSQSLTSMTGGRGDYHMEFLRYEEVPAHIAQKLIDAAKKEKEAVPA